MEGVQPSGGRLFSFKEKPQRHRIPFHAKAGDHPNALGRDQTLVPKFFPCIHIGNMHFNHWCFYRTDGIVNSHGRVRVGSCIDDDPIEAKSHLMQFVDQLPLYIGLKIMKFDNGKS